MNRLMTALAEAPVHMDIIGELRRDPFICRDNLCLLDPELATKEITHFKRAGGKTIVDCTTIDLGRDVRVLRSISKTTDLNIIAGTGFYIDRFNPRYVKERTDEELAAQMIGEIERGVDDTGIRCGIIGEIGTEWPLTPSEHKVLRAAVYAQQKTGSPMNIHLPPEEKNGHAILDILHEHGASFEKVVLDHIDGCGFNPEYAASLANVVATLDSIHSVARRTTIAREARPHRH